MAGHYQDKDGNEQEQNHHSHGHKGIGGYVLQLSGGGSGGRGAYQFCDGDVPVARVWQDPLGIKSKSADQFVVLSKNLTSIQSDNRWEQLMGELTTLQWDVVLCQET